MKHETTTTATTQTSSVPKAESKSRSVSVSTTPSRLRASSKAKDSSSPKPETWNGVSPSIKGRPMSVPRGIQNTTTNSQKTRRALVLNKPKSVEDVAVSNVGTDKGKQLEEVKATSRYGIQPAAEQLARLTRPRGMSVTNSSRKKEGDVDGKKKELQLQEKLYQSEALIKSLQGEALELKAELDKAQGLNSVLQSQNNKLSDKLAAAEAKIAALPIHDQTDTVAKDQSPIFEDIQKLNAQKLEHPNTIEGIKETRTVRRPSAVEVVCTRQATTNADINVTDSPSMQPTPPPPPPLPGLPAGAASAGKASAVVQLYQSLIKRDSNKNPSVGTNCHKPTISTAHNSIVGEIQNRSAHLLAIKFDIETKGEFINGLIQKVLDAAYTDIEDVLKFVDWLDNELLSLADERAVLKHFKWPEKKADAMREAAMEYRGLRILESEISSFKDDANIPCEIALKKMAGLLDKSERSIQRLIKLRNSVMLSYHNHNIPTNWMLDSGIVSKIKQTSMMLANLYVKRITMELQSLRYSERESSQEALLLQGVYFAYRAHQFAGGLDSDTLCAFEEIRQLVPEHLRGSQELLVVIPSS